jgi:hypothetical protein
MPLRHSLLAFCIVAILAGECAMGASPVASPTPHLWSALIYATNPAHPAQAPDRLRRYFAKLKHIFGYSQYELVGESAQKLDGVNERWLMPSQDFNISVVPHGGPGNPAKLTLFQLHHKVAEFETHLSPDSPLFIRGPLYGGGQLFIVVHMRTDPAPAPAAVRIQQRPPIVVAGPSPSLNSRKNPIAADLAKLPPKDHGPLTPATPLGPSPASHFGPGPLDPFEPGLHDRFDPLPGGRGDMDSKLKGP